MFDVDRNTTTIILLLLQCNNQLDSTRQYSLHYNYPSVIIMSDYAEHCVVNCNPTYHISHLEYL